VAPESGSPELLSITDASIIKKVSHPTSPTLNAMNSKKRERRAKFPKRVPANLESTYATNTNARFGSIAESVVQDSRAVLPGPCQPINELRGDRLQSARGGQPRPANDSRVPTAQCSLCATDTVPPDKPSKNRPSSLQGPGLVGLWDTIHRFLKLDNRIINHRVKFVVDVQLHLVGPDWIPLVESVRNPF